MRFSYLRLTEQNNTNTSLRRDLKSIGYILNWLLKHFLFPLFIIIKLTGAVLSSQDNQEIPWRKSAKIDQLLADFLRQSAIAQV
jgi:hypothetical protein